MAIKPENLPVRIEVVELEGKKTLRIDSKLKSIIVKSDVSNFVIGALMAAVVVIIVFSILLKSGRLTTPLAMAIGIPSLIVGGSLLTWFMAKGETDRKALFFQINDKKITYWWEGKQAEALKRSVKSFYVQFKLKSRQIPGTEGMKIKYQKHTIYQTTCLTHRDVKAARAYLKTGKVERT